MNGVIFVGQNPKNEDNIKFPFMETKSLTVLLRWFKELKLKECEMINASDKIGIICMKDIAKQRLLDLKTTNRKVIALGKYAHKALTSLSVVHFVLPHPSGRNRKLNDPQYIQDLLDQCKKFLAS